MTNRVTAVFHDRAQAENAVNALRQLGVTDAHMSLVAQHTNTASHAAAAAADDAADKADGASKGLLAGAGVGALFGLGAALIPGVGPFITAGTLLSSALGAVGGGMVAGAVVGGTTGAVAGALSRAGYNEHEASYYGSAVESGGILLAVDTGAGVSADQVRAVVTQYGGQTYTA